MRIFKPRNSTGTAVADREAAPAPPPQPAPRPVQPMTWPGMDLLADPVCAEVLMSAWSGDPVICVPSPPGSGKTRLTVQVASALSHRAGLRVGIAAQTRAQAIEIARRLAALCDHTKIGLLWSNAKVTPDTGGCPLVRSVDASWPATAGAVRVATTAKWLRCQPDRQRADVLIVDEAYQATYADVGALGVMATQIVCVGDPGQIDPVVTGDVSRWEGSATGPHLPAPQALMAAHPGVVNTVALRHTWRLGPQTTALVQSAFYPDLPFTSRRPPEHVSAGGVELPELAHRQITVSNGYTDPALIGATVARVRELIGHASLTTAAGTRALRASDVAVVVPHVVQSAAVQALLAEHPDTLVGTTNALQGLERPAVVAVHPLAGKRIADEFSLDSGRQCVMLSRHRAHLTVIVDDHTADVLADSEGDPAVRASAAVFAAIRQTAAI